MTTGYPNYAEPFNLAQQSGAFEVRSLGDLTHKKVVVQVAPQAPVDTCRPEKMPRPVAVLGNFSWWVHPVTMVTMLILHGTLVVGTFSNHGNYANSS